MDTSGQKIHGRRTELSRLRALLDRLPAGGGALVLHGEPGIGRSTLLDWAATLAESRGVLVVEMTAVEDDFRVPYAGLRRLADHLPQAVGDVVIEAISTGRPLSKVAFALLESVGAVADEQPVLVVVDDGQWMDHLSWTALTFVARRLTHRPALMLLAMREGSATSTRLPGSGLAELSVEPLDRESAIELLSQRAPGLPTDLAEQVAALARGNPLGLVELGGVAKAGTSSAADLPLPIRLERRFAQVAESLPRPTRTLVEVAALDDGPDTDEIMAAARLLDPAVSEDDLAPALAERVLEIVADTRIDFRHPLMRAAVRQAMDLDRRRQIHQALSSVLAGNSTQQLWHRANAAPALDARLAVDLAEAAALAYQRGDVDSAVQAYERAAELIEERVTRADLLLSATHIAYLAGAPSTVRRLLNRLADQVLPAATQAHCAQLRESIDSDVRSGSDSARRLLSIVEELVGRDQFDLALQSADLHAYNLVYAYGYIPPDLETRDRVLELIQRLPVAHDDPRKLCVLSLMAPLEQCATVLPIVRQQATALTAGPTELHLLALAAFGIGALPVALRLASAAVPGLRAQRLVGLLGQALNLQSAVATQLGFVTLATSSAAEAQQVATEIAQPRWAARADLAAAGAAALGGDDRTAQALADSAERTLQLTGVDSSPAIVHMVRGQAAAAAGRFDVAFDGLRALFAPHPLSYPVDLRFWALPLLAETAMLSSRREQLAAIMVGLAPLRGLGLPIQDVGLAYAAAVLTDAEEGYNKALAREELGDWPFELARLQQAYGGWLRRQRRSVEARPLLRSAANTFGVLGATPWAARAEAELRASGERRQRPSETWRTLTPQELQIAQLAAEGLSNRMIATRLVLSTRTIDSHLYRAFRKLGVTSRTQLSELLPHSNLTTGLSTPAVEQAPAGGSDDGV